MMMVRQGVMAFHPVRIKARECSGFTWGLEEEVFITEPEHPSLASLYYLSRLLLRDPKHYYYYSASNFARGRDVHECLMSGIEIATTPHSSLEGLLEDLRKRRADLSWAVEKSYIVPVGHLFDLDSPSNTSGLHLHVGVEPELRLRVYQNIAYFLPVLILLSASSPFRGGRYFGPSYRVASSFAIGPLQEDPTYRFQDLIISRRLQTVEIRVLDPIWDLERLRWLLRVVQVVVNLPVVYPLDRERYLDLREQACREGYTRDLRRLYRELKAYLPLPENYLERSISDELAEWVARYGRAATYRALDRAYRTGRLEYVPAHHFRKQPWKSVAGLMGYYLLRLPYTLYKGWREWH